jgi:hypothetical protein
MKHPRMFRGDDRGTYRKENEVIYSKDARDTALELMARFGLWPVAIHPGGKIPIGWSKAPAKPTEESIKATFAAYPGAGVGILLGKDCGVIDIECDGFDGAKSLENLLGTCLPSTMGWSSAKGPHYLFKYDPRLARYGKNVITLACLPDLEIRIGGLDGPLQSNCPPTVGTDGKPRKWFDDDVVASLPDAVFAFLDAHRHEMQDEPTGSPNAMTRSANDDVPLEVAIKTLVNAFVKAFKSVQV